MGANGPAWMTAEYSRVCALGWEGPHTGDGLGLKKLLTETIPKRDAALANFKADEVRYDTLVLSLRDIDQRRKRATDALNAKYLDSLDEVISNPASDSQGLADYLLPMEGNVALLANAQDRLNHTLIPEALIRKQESLVKLREIEALEAGLHAAVSECDTLDRLERAGVFASEGRVFVAGEETEKLKAAAREANRLANVAVADLEAERTQQLTTTQTRHSTGHITKAEAIYAAVELSRTKGEAENV
jgi:hypothetical protein